MPAIGPYSAIARRCDTPSPRLTPPPLWVPLLCKQPNIIDCNWAIVDLHRDWLRYLRKRKAIDNPKNLLSLNLGDSLKRLKSRAKP